jgi:hypothetical protein
MTLQKRDNEGFAIPPALIIFLIILGAGFGVCVVFAVVGMHSDPHDPDRWQKRRPDQDAYMREVRERNHFKLESMSMRGLHAPRNQNLAHAPMSPR